VDHRRPLPSALNCATKPLLAYSWQRQTVCTTPAVTEKSGALVAPPTVAILLRSTARDLPESAAYHFSFLKQAGMAAT
jgi:hypothetical protein